MWSCLVVIFLVIILIIDSVNNYIFHLRMPSDKSYVIFLDTICL